MFVMKIALRSLQAASEHAVQSEHATDQLQKTTLLSRASVETADDLMGDVEEDEV